MKWEIDGTILKKCTPKDGEIQAVIPESVTSIGDSAFSGCTGLTSITIPKSVMSIGNSAFSGCTNLTNITIPESVTNIGDRVFSGCITLTSIIIPESVISIRSAFIGCTSLTSIIIPESVTNIWGAFSGCTALTCITIPKSVTDISNAFSGCTALTSITIPEGVIDIWNAFTGCTALTSITIPESVTSIGGAFSGCTALTSITIPESVTNIYGAFSDCTALTSITIPESVTSIGYSTFSDCTALTSIRIPESVTHIADRTFRGCVALTSITIPKSVTSIGEGAFHGCTALTSITIPESVTSINTHAFSMCTALTSIRIPESVTYIGDHAFSGCSGLTSMTIPENVSIIGEGAFDNCSNLTSVIFTHNVPSIGNNAFSNATVFLPEKCLQTSKKIPADIIRYLSTINAEDFAYLYLFQTTKAWNEFLNTQVCIAVEPNDAIKSMLAILQVKSGKNNNYAAKVAGFIEENAPQISCDKLKEAISWLKVIGYGEVSKLEVNSIIKNILKNQPLLDVNPIEEFIGRLMKAETIQPDVMKLRKTSIRYADSDQVSSREAVVLLLNEYAKEWKKNAHEVAKEYQRDADEESGHKYTISMLTTESRVRVSETADKIAAALNREDLSAYLKNLAYGNNYRPFILSYTRFATEESVTAFIADIRKASRGATKEKYWAENAKNALLINDTRAAMLFFEKEGLLDKYAGLRGLSADVLRDSVMSDFGLDTEGKKEYDLGGKTIIARMNSQFAVELFDSVGKLISSLPKRNAVAEKYDAANKDFSEMKKNIKKAAKARSDRLFILFLQGATFKPSEWKQIYLGKNPLLRQIAGLLIWQQSEKTFTVFGNQTVDNAGNPIDLNITKAIKLAHPMEMHIEDITAWQKHFTNSGLKQPFEQVWEPIVDLRIVEGARYANNPIPLYRFSDQKKHGIDMTVLYKYNPSTYSNQISDVSIRMDGCSAEWVYEDGHNDGTMKDTNIDIKQIKILKHTRTTNHIISYLDKIVAFGKILKDDVTINPLLDSFTLAQLMEFINLATKNKSVQVTALLLNYKNMRYPDYTQMDELILEY